MWKGFLGCGVTVTWYRLYNTIKAESNVPVDKTSVDIWFILNVTCIDFKADRFRCVNDSYVNAYL